MCGKYDPNIHNRRSIRLDGYDYSQEGWYSVTICVQGHVCMFGDIVNDQMRLNEAGFMVRTWWRKVGSKFPPVQTDRYIIMPNHFHGIVNVKGQPHGVAPTMNNATGQPCGFASTLGNIVNWFKTMTTNQYIRGVKHKGWSQFGGKLWQRNYYEHIIRNEEELNHVRQYITENPLNWRTDEENPDVTDNRIL
jgi:REP element-mobilizing transposase RayT